MANFTLSRTSSLSTARSRQKPGPGASRTIFRDAKNHRRFGLGSGPSGCPKARSRRFDAGVGPVGLPEKTFCATAEASGLPETTSGRRPKLPRQPWQTRAVVRWGLARRASRNNFPGNGQSICDSVPRARFRRFSAGEWPDGLPETSFRAMQASATAMANPRRRSRALRYCGAGGWPVGLPETTFGATAKASATASLAPASVVLALGSGRTGFPKQVPERRKAGGSWTPPRHMRPEPAAFFFCFLRSSLESSL